MLSWNVISSSLVLFSNDLTKKTEPPKSVVSVLEKTTYLLSISRQFIEGSDNWSIFVEIKYARAVCRKIQVYMTMTDGVNFICAVIYTN